MRRFFTSESVTEGHPDKLADQISDALLDAFLAEEPECHVATDKTLVTTGIVFVAGEVSTEGYVDIPGVVRRTIKRIGYIDANYGIDGETCGVITSIDEQSPDIAQGVKKGKKVGAGDQGIMFGYATNETPEYMPPTIVYAHRLAKRLADVRKTKTLDYLRPDGKTQVTLEFGEKGNVLRCEAVVVAAQHEAHATNQQIHADIRKEVVEKVMPPEWLDKNTKYFINHTGRFVKGGPAADSGLTGRKIIVDTYGGVVPHGGGAFSGKDPTKVDRSAAYYARYAAKNLVAAGFADKLLIQVGYSIGATEPLSLHVTTYGTARVPEERIEQVLRSEFDFAPGSIIDELELRKPQFEPTAAYGHFGRNDLKLKWEALDRVSSLQGKLGLKATTRAR
ncbi:MAG: methionine adenosyltransferase [Euryarchaeota archaeon]|nr:methionine adenosyltransferase [Euryarchaeota archaeon]